MSELSKHNIDKPRCALIIVQRNYQVFGKSF